MPRNGFITLDDIYMRIYQEQVDEITRTNDDIVYTAMSSAIEEAKMYLSRYDLGALFGVDGEEPRNPSFLLKSICVSIAVMRLVELANPGIDYDKAKESYDAALRNLRDIQALRANPEGWPYKDTTGQTAPEGSTVSASYNRKRNNDF